MLKALVARWQVLELSWQLSAMLMALLARLSNLGGMYIVGRAGVALIKRHPLYQLLGVRRPPVST